MTWAVPKIERASSALAGWGALVYLEATGGSVQTSRCRTWSQSLQTSRRVQTPSICEQTETRERDPQRWQAFIGDVSVAVL